MLPTWSQNSLLSPSVTFPHFTTWVGRLFNENIFPKTPVIHGGRQTEPHFCIPSPIPSSSLLSSSVQILSSCHFKVQCDLGFAPLWCTIKAGHTNMLAPSQGLHHTSFCRFCYCRSIPLFHSQALILSLSISLSPRLSLSLLSICLHSLSSPSLLGLISLSF